MSVRHVGICVNNIDKQIEFYKDLGFEIINDSEIKSELIQKLYNTSYLYMDLYCVKLKSKKDNSIIELIKQKHFTFESLYHELYQMAITHIAITVDNLHEIYLKLYKNGITFFSPPIETKDNVKVCFCRDYEGNILELVEDLK